MSEQPILYSQPDCFGCDSARRFFAQHGIDYTEKDISTDLAAYAEFRRLGLPSTPVILIGQQKILGFQRRALEVALGISGGTP